MLAPPGIHGAGPCWTVLRLIIRLSRQSANAVPLAAQTSVLSDTSNQGRSTLGTRLENQAQCPDQGLISNEFGIIALTRYILVNSGMPNGPQPYIRDRNPF